MTTNELVKLKKGNYKLTDGIWLYNLEIGLNDNKTKYYQITEFGSLPFSARIYILQEWVIEEGKKCRRFRVMSGVCGIRIHSLEHIYEVLSDLRHAE